jgi:hypothetical protein
MVDLVRRYKSQMSVERYASNYSHGEYRYAVLEPSGPRRVPTRRHSVGPGYQLPM